MSIFFKLVLFFFCTTAFAADPPLQLYDEGVKQGVIFNVDCVGSGISCAKSNVTGTLTVSGGGTGTAAGGLNAVQYNSPIGTFAGSENKFSFNGTNVGVGTTNGNALLSINSTASQDLFRVDDNGIDDPSPFIISSSGNIGIGTADLSTGTKFRVSSTGAYPVWFDAQQDGPVYFVFDNSLSAVAGSYDETVNIAGFMRGSTNINRNAGLITFGKEEDYTSASLSDSFISFSTAVNDTNVEKVRIISNGNVGISSVNPVEKLDVVGKTKTTNLQISSISGSTNCLQADSSGNVSGAGAACSTGAIADDRSILYYDSGLTLGDAANLSFNSSNNVGIGTSNAKALLNIASTSAINLFRLDDNGANDTSPFVIDSTGNVGIGSINPNKKLVVNGDAIFGNNASAGTATPLKVSFGGTYGTNTPGTVGNLKWALYEDTYASNTYGIGMSSGLMELRAGASAGIAFYTNNGNELMKLSSTGSVGIGVTSPTAILDILSTSSSDVLRVNDSSAGESTPFIISATGNVGIGTSTALGNMASDKIVMLGQDSLGPIYLGNNNYDFIIGSSLGSGAKFRLLPYLGDIYFENFTPASATVSGNIIFRHDWNGGVSVQEDMRIDVNGNMGLGLTAPKALLNAGTTTAKDIFRIDDNGAGDTTPFIINSIGNVGIGTTGPMALLEITQISSWDSFRVNDDGPDSTPFIIDSAGNVGIGSTIPEQIVVIGNNTSTTRYISMNGGRGYFGYDSTANSSNGGLAIGVGNLKGIDFYINGTSGTPLSGTKSLTVGSNGNIGIGTGNPTVEAAYKGLEIRSVTNAGSQLVLDTTDSDRMPQIVFEEANTAKWKIYNETVTDSLRFKTGATDVLTITTGGNIGISTALPSYGLDISDGQYALVIGADNAAKTRTNSTQKISRFGGAHYTNSEEPVAFFSSNSANGYNNISFGGGTSLMNAATNLYFYTASNGTTTTGTSRMLINGTGNVGIGTTILDSGILQLPQNGTAQGHASCWGTNNCAGYCTDAVGVTGTCTCTCL